MSLATFTMLVLSASATTGARAATNEFAVALTEFRAGEYDKVARALPALGDALPKNRDYYLYFLGESQFYAGAYAKARAAFAELGRVHDSRFAGIAGARVADCLWMEGKREEAAAAYRKHLGGKPAFDQAVARFRVAEVQAEAAARSKNDKDSKSATETAARAFMQIHVDFPAHPLGVEAGKRAALLAPAAANQPAVGEPTPGERLQRAATLSKSHHWQEALDELALLPAALSPELGAQRDLALGMAKYQARRDYAGAAALLLGVAPKLPGEKAAFAAFHGARALSRIDRDDEAIANYRLVVAKYPGASWAAEAQFRSGWLEINRGHFREALPGLRETLRRYPKSAFADDAAWYLAFAHYLLGDSAEALKAITTYAEVARPSNEEAAMRVRYWRARILAQAGRQDEAKALLRECVSHAPYHYYGLLARARLRELGESPPWPQLPGRAAEPAPLHDPVIARALDLDRVGLGTEAGAEIERNESGILKRNGKARALPFLLATYPRFSAFHRAHKLAESSGEAALGDSPRLFWEATYPRAYPDAAQSYGKAFGSPDLFVYAIMRKESSYFPFALSSSDARGLLQLIPATADQVAKKLSLASYADELFDPDTNLHLGIAYLGGLLHRFQGQEALAAGAYNAGAHAMARWCDLWSDRPLDEFVELITYDQAREYIKRVLGIYARYRWLYAQPLELSLVVNTRYAKDGPDF
jgi:soluble lytic murein transglycosylase